MLSDSSQKPRVIHRYDITPQWDNKQSLLPRIQKMDKEIPIVMPPPQILPQIQAVLRFVLGLAQIDDEGVAPPAKALPDAVRPAQQLAHRRPRLRRELRHGDLPVPRHVCGLGRPCRLVRWRHAQPRPHVGRELSGLFPREAFLNLREPVLQELLLLGFGQDVVWIDGGLGQCRVGLGCGRGFEEVGLNGPAWEKAFQRRGDILVAFDGWGGRGGHFGAELELVILE